MMIFLGDRDLPAIFSGRGRRLQTCREDCLPVVLATLAVVFFPGDHPGRASSEIEGGAATGQQAVVPLTSDCRCEC